MSILVDIEKSFGDFKLRSEFSGGDEIISLLGASGCGKSVTLRCIAGIEHPDRGRIIVNGKTLFDSEKKINLTPQERHAGLMFQNYALFPNMTVLQNIKAGAKREKDPAKREALTESIIESFDLSHILNHYPRQISGGQQQRTALARMLVSSPEILLLDEPFSALDSHLRFRLEQEVSSIIHEFGKTVILVSHDRDEVFRLSDKIAVINNGNIETFGTKEEVFRNPRTRNGAILTGCKNITKMEKIDENHIFAEDWGIKLKTSAVHEGEEYAGIRMHDIKFYTEEDESPDENIFRCRVVNVIENPFSFTIMMKPVGADCKTTIGWDTDKTIWNEVRAEEINIKIPEDNVILLRK